jgi:sec-independent protein translocase protein TatB
MFELDWGKLVVIGVIALIVIGPKELPTVLRAAGRWMGKVRRMASEFQGQFQDALREAELHDLKKHADDLTGSVSQSVADMQSFDPLAETQKEIESALPPEPEKLTDQSAPAALAPADAPPAPPAVATLPEPAAAHDAPKTSGGGA